MSKCTLFGFQVNDFDSEGHVNLENDKIRRAEDAGEMYLGFRVACLIFMLEDYAFGNDPIQEGRLCKA